MSAESEMPRQLDRRNLLLGGAAALAAGGLLVVAPGAVAEAASGSGAAPGRQGDGTAPTTAGRAAPQSSPVTTTIASTPVSGWTYRNVCMYDFEPFDPAAQKTWGGSGIYSAGTSTTMRATVEVPAGALVREVEYYIFNSSGSNVFPDTWLYTPGHGTIASIGASTTVASTSAITANRVMPPSSIGPYPLGSRLLLGVSTPTTGTVQINGARVGFSEGGAASGLLDAPIRAYDSRGGDGPIAGGATRTITLPSSVVVPGTSGILANITAVGGAGVGFLKIWSASATEPPASAINFPATTAIANAMVIAVSNLRQIKIKASTTVHVIVDVTGTVA